MVLTDSLPATYMDRENTAVPIETVPASAPLQCDQSDIAETHSVAAFFLKGATEHRYQQDEGIPRLLSPQLSQSTKSLCDKDEVLHPGNEPLPFVSVPDSAGQRDVDDDADGQVGILTKSRDHLSLASNLGQPAEEIVPPTKNDTVDSGVNQSVLGNQGTEGPPILSPRPIRRVTLPQLSFCVLEESSIMDQDHEQPHQQPHQQQQQQQQHPQSDHQTSASHENFQSCTALDPHQERVQEVCESRYARSDAGHQTHPDVGPGPPPIGVRDPLPSLVYDRYDVPFYGFENVDISSSSYGRMWAGLQGQEAVEGSINASTSSHTGGTAHENPLAFHREFIWAIAHEDEYGDESSPKTATEVEARGRHKRQTLWVPVPLSPRRPALARVRRSREISHTEGRYYKRSGGSRTGSMAGASEVGRVSQGVYAPDSFAESQQQPSGDDPKGRRGKAKGGFRRHWKNMVVVILVLGVGIGALAAVLVSKKSGQRPKDKEDVYESGLGGEDVDKDPVKPTNKTVVTKTVSNKAPTSTSKPTKSNAPATSTAGAVQKGASPSTSQASSSTPAA